MRTYLANPDQTHLEKITSAGNSSQRAPSVSGIFAAPGTRPYSPAALAAWEAGLATREELCLSVPGTRRGKITIYAGPGRRYGALVAILTGNTYVSRPWNSDIEAWATSLLETAKTLHSKHPDRGTGGHGLLSAATTT